MSRFKYGLITLVLGCMFQPAFGQQGNNHRLDSVFEKYDLNKDGFLDLEELAKAYRGPTAKPIIDKIGEKESHAEHKFVDTWDNNKDGKISKAEWEKYEAKVVADNAAIMKKQRNYSPRGRTAYRTSAYRRSPYGTNNRFAGYGNGNSYNPYLTVLKYQQRTYQLQRQMYSNLLRGANYSPTVRNSYRGRPTYRR